MEKILVVDDSTFQRGKIVQILQSAGYQTDQCTNGREALELLSTQRPLVVLLDLLMPEIDGFGVLETLYRRGNKIPVVVLTADIQETQRQRCLELGAVEFLNKPPKAAQLVDAIQRHIQKVPVDNDQIIERISPAQRDAITEVFNIGIGQAASVLNEMVAGHVELKIPRLSLLKKAELKQYLEEKHEQLFSSVLLGFCGDISGSSSLLFSSDDAVKLVSLLTSEDSLPLESVTETTLLEVGNIVINSVMGAIANTVGRTLQYSVPEYRRDTAKNLLMKSENHSERLCVVADTSFQIRSRRIEGHMLFLFEVDSFMSILDSVSSVHR